MVVVVSAMRGVTDNLIGLAKEKPEGGYDFILDGSSYEIEDVLEISKIAEKHGYIVIY